MICPVCRGPLRWHEEKYSCVVCGYEPPKAVDAKRTRYARFKDMSLDELAEFLTNNFVCIKQTLNEKGWEAFFLKSKDTKPLIVDWLKQEVAE